MSDPKPKFDPTEKSVEERLQLIEGFLENYIREAKTNADSPVGSQPSN